MKIMLLDDDKASLIIMRNMISKIPEIELAGSFQSTSEAYQFIRNNQVDMAFVDINMPEENGLNFVKRVRLEVSDIIVTFLTAHKEYALEAFEVHAFDYIIKPITHLKLINSIQDAKQRLVLQTVKDYISSKKLVVQCLGGIEARSANNERVQFTSTKSMELFSYLLLKKGLFVSKWRIIEDVFTGMPPLNAETYLNTTIYKLRKSLEPFGMKSAIESADGCYKINMKDIHVDFVEFENNLILYTDFNADNQDKVLNIEKLFLGELFGDKDYYWSLPEKERLTEVYMSFSKKLARYLIESNQITGALQIAKRLVHLNELDEEANCLLMEIYSSQKNRMLLDRQYKRYEEVLKSELGLVPDTIVVNLYEGLLMACMQV